MKRAMVLVSFIFVFQCGVTPGFSQDNSAHSLPPATVDLPYGAQLQINVSGIAPFTYSFSDGTHPDWLKLSPTDGNFSGTPTANSAGNYAFKTMVTDAGGHQTTTDLTLSVLAKDKTPVVSIAATPNSNVTTCKPVSISEGLKPGSTTLKGTATPSQGSTDISLSVDVIYGAVNPSQALADLQDDESVRRAQRSHAALPNLNHTVFRSKLASEGSGSSRVGSDGTFTLQLAQPLDGGESVIVTQHGCQNPPKSVSDVGSAQSSNEDKSGVSTNSKAIAASDNSQKSKTTGTQSNSAPAPASSSSTQMSSTTAAGSNGVGSSTGSGAASKSAAAWGGSSSSSSSAATSYSVPGNLDWGLVKALFMVGAIFSNQNQSFSQSNLFVSFDLDKAWALPSNYGYAETASGYEKYPGQSGHKPGFNSFFEARLTAIPVSSNTSTDSKASQNGTGSTSATTSSSATLSSFLTNQKTARFGFGVYSPFLITRWTHDEGPQALYIAPLVKGGFDTLTESTQVTSPSTTGAGTLQIPRVYNYFSGGLRLGHYRLHNDANEAPDHISHLDAVFGKFSNFETLVDNCPSGFTACRTRLWRMAFEGLLQIPTPDSFPLYVGFSANIGQKVFGASHVIPGGDAGDDLRFFFGTRLDLGSLVTKLKGISGSSGSGTTE